MNVFLEPPAREYVRQRGGHLILFQAEVSGCCGLGRALVPMQEVGYPRRPLNEYTSLESEGVTIHVGVALAARNESIRVSLTQVLGWSKLSLTLEEGLNPAFDSCVD